MPINDTDAEPPVRDASLAPSGDDGANAAGLEATPDDSDRFNPCPPPLATAVRAARVLAVTDTDSATSGYLQTGYDFGLAYVPPITSEGATIIDGYVCDQKPGDFNHNYQTRAAAETAHSATFKCSVSGDFIDDSIFTDTNILLEILQNAEPNDSKGTWFSLEFYADGAWRSVTEEIANFGDDQIEAVRIPDNGRGYLPTDMTTIGGGKRSDPRSAGRFGTGMKISDRSALGKGVKIRRYSRNWQAEPFLEPVLTSAGRNYTVSYKVDFFNDCLAGSVVEYRDLTPEMVTTLRRVQDLYLPLDATLKDRLLAQTEAGLILKPKSHQGTVIMVKGRVYELRVNMPTPLLFSYDLHDCVIDDQNRHYVGLSEAAENIEAIWSSSDDPELFKQLFREARDSHKYHEHTMSGLQPVPEAFKQAATDFYGIKNFDTTFIDDEGTTEKQRRLLVSQGYQGIKIPEHRNGRFIQSTFENAGILTGNKFLESISFTRHFEIKEENEGENFASCVCRAVAMLDRLGNGVRDMQVFCSQNDDQEQSFAYADFLARVKAGEKLNPVRFVVSIESDPFAEQRDGGSDSYTNQYEWASRFDDIFCSAVSSGTDVNLYSGTYQLIASKSSRSYGSLTRYEWAKLPPRKLEIHIDVKNDYEAGELRKLHEYSLNLDPNYQPIERTEHGDIVKLEGATLYEQGIKKNEGRLFGAPKNADRILSYNLPERVSEETMDGAIAKIVAATQNENVPVAILKRANDEDREKYFVEYLSGDNIPANPDIWKQTFESVFGSDAVVDDLEGHPMKELAIAVKESSNIKRIRLNPKLVATLCACGVAKLSQAVKADKVAEYSPTPVQQALLSVERLADEAIKMALPRGVPFIEFTGPQVKATKSVKNSYGQEIKSGSGYMDPFLEDLTIYVLEDIVKPRKVEQLFSFILRKKIDAYRKVMNAHDHAEFRAEAIAVADATMMQARFYRKVSLMMYQRETKIPELVEKTAAEMRAARAPEDNFRLVPDDGKGRRRIGAMDKWIRTLTARIDGIVTALKATKGEEVQVKKPVSPAKPKSIPIRLSLGTGALALAGTALMAILVARFTPENLKREFEARITEMLPEPSPSDGQGGHSRLDELLQKLASVFGSDNTDGYVRPHMANRTRIGVEIDRYRMDGDFDSPSAYIGHQLATFVSAPALEWGDFMSEQSQTVYDGQGWLHDENAPNFENPDFPEVRRIAHYQVIGKQREFTLRTRAGGYIGQSSIRVIKKDGTATGNFTIEQENSGEFTLKIRDDEAAAVRYNTASPINWQETAEELTDADFARLPADAYAYYTKKPAINPGMVKFTSSLFPKFSTLDQFLNFLKTKKPFERLKIIRAVVSKMRYTSTERTEKAYGRFHAEKLPQRDFLDFVLSSSELEQPGDGDCDAQNSTFALLARLAGLPAKLDFVFTNNGVGHGPASVFLPGVGWVLFDTMGERVLKEEIHYGSGALPYGRRTELSPEIVEEALREQLRRQREYRDKGCFELQ